MGGDELKGCLLEKALPFIGEEGWGWRALSKGSEALGEHPSLPEAIFSEGLAGALESLIDVLDRESNHGIDVYMSTLKPNERPRMSRMLEWALVARLTFMEHHRKAFQKIIRYVLHPARWGLAIRLSSRAIDRLWYRVGDQATDFNFYSKRLLLGYVYDATLLHFLRSSSLDESVAFLKRRFSDVERLASFKQCLKKNVACLGFAFLALMQPADAQVLSATTQQTLERALNDIQTMEADFHQTNPDGTLAKGRFYLTRPSHIRFTYTDPEGHYILCDKEWVVHYDPDLKDYSSISADSTPARFFLREKLILDGDIQVKDMEETQDSITLTLMDANESAKVILVLAKKPFHIKKWTIIDAQGHVSEVHLSRVRLNQPLDPSIYKMPPRRRTKA